LPGDGELFAFHQVKEMEPHHELELPVALVGVVDDDPAVRNSLKFSLEIEGFAVGVYSNADELLQERNLDRFRCFVVDHHMPGTAGLDLVAALHAMHILVPVILITSHSPRALTDRAARAGVPIVEKPLLGNALPDKIREVIGRVPRRS
jgi:two-component system, LuxR family, response regulator FixJ